jgi:hypothetical protein
MKPTKKTFIQEYKFRIQLLDKSIKENDYSIVLRDILENEKSILEEVINNYLYFERVEAKKQYDKSKLTPLIDSNNIPLIIGDKVENEKKQCGTLEFDSFWNEYLIKSKSGGNIRFRNIKKIDQLYENNIDTTKVECRRNVR